MRDDGRRNGWVLLLAIAAGMALGAWLAVWVAELAASAPSGGDPTGRGRVTLPECAGSDVAVDFLQVLQAFTPERPMSLPLPAGGLEGGVPKILLVALPGFGSRQRAFLFIRPADPALCRTLHGVALAAYWNGTEPTTLCAVGDPPSAGSPEASVEFFLRRSS